MAPAAPVTTSFPGSLLERPNIVDRYYSTVRWWYSILGWVSFLLRMLMPSSPPTRFREAHILTTSTIPSTNHQPSSKLRAWDWEYEYGIPLKKTESMNIYDKGTESSLQFFPFGSMTRISGLERRLHIRIKNREKSSLNPRTIA